MNPTLTLETRDRAPELGDHGARPGPNPYLAALHENRAAIEASTRSLLDRAGTEQRQLNDREQREYDGALEELAALSRRIEQLEDAEQRGNRAAAAAVGISGGSLGGELVRVGREAGTYRSDNRSDFLGDLARWSILHDINAGQRLQRHAGETRDMSRVDTAGGEFVPPAWLMHDYAPLARAGRVLADRFTHRPMPAGTDQINIPKITTGTSVAVQTADNAAVAEQDMVTAPVSAPVRTLAGQVDVALQMLEQSPLPFDQVAFGDLLGDYGRALDVQCIAGSGSSGQLQGVLGLSGINAVTYTDASPTVPELYPKLGEVLRQVLSARKLGAEALVMHTDTWTWILSTLDSSSRPLVVPTAQGPTNAPATSEQTVNLDQRVGTILGLPVYLDANMPGNLGDGTNETRLIAGRFSDSLLFETEPRLRVLPEVGSGTLTVRIQLYAYVALAHRFPASFGVLAGTGLITPAL